jgi:UBA/TS-N domain
MGSVNEYDIEQLTAIGFPESEARVALQISSGNLELAVNQLLSGVGTATSTFPSPPPEVLAPTSACLDTNVLLVQGTTSQYTFAEIGRSACTCIALTAAGMFLSSATNITQDFLDHMISLGIENYQALAMTTTQASNNPTSAVLEHMSAEEVLQQDGSGGRFGVQCTAGGVRQGILGYDRDHPLGLKSILEGICMEIRSHNQWTCIVMTKTPETVLICFPPQSKSRESSFPDTASSFWLIDSHPRPQCGTSNAYAMSHSTLESLLQSLFTIFPTTDLGPDVPEIMAQMYNTFDLYPLESC